MNDILAPKLVGLDVTDQAKIDKLMVEETLGLHEKFTIVHSSYCNSWPPEAHLGAFKSHQQFRWFEWFLWAPVWGDLATDNVIYVISLKFILFPDNLGWISSSDSISATCFCDT